MTCQEIMPLLSNSLLFFSADFNKIWNAKVDNKNALIIKSYYPLWIAYTLQNG